MIVNKHGDSFINSPGHTSSCFQIHLS